MNVTRREMLGTMPATMAGAWALAGQGLQGQSGGGLVPAKLGVQLYTVRDQLKTLDATLGAIKAAGFDEVETLRPILADLPPLLKKHGLTAPSGHFDAALVLDVGEVAKKGLGTYTFENAVAQAKAVDMKFFVLPYLMGEDRASIDDYKRHADKMNEAGRRCKAAGLQFAYHHHSFEFVKYGTETGWDVLVARLDKDLVALEVDVFWLAAAGLDPAATIKQLGSQVKLVHLKDRAAGPPALDESKVAKTAFKEVGSGTLDFPAILRACKDVGVQHYFVEQDQVPADPLASLKQSVIYLRSLKG
ncbi:MAG: sugar phosphate isomerase/epimerase [Vicinamibacteraceae bacterium]